MKLGHTYNNILKLISGSSGKLVASAACCIRYAKYIKQLLLALWMTAALASPVGALSDIASDDDIFGVAPVDDTELADIRGGFIAPGGLMIDFTLTNQTIINGETLADISVNSEELSGVNIEDLQRFIQVGENNRFESVDEILRNAGLVTVVQNSLDGTVIQTISTLDVTVHNFNEYQDNVPLNNALESAGNIGLR